MVPIVIIAYNNYTFVKSFVEQIRDITDSIIIVDNNSGYPKMHEYYESLKDDKQVTIHRLNYNYGHNVYVDRMDLLPDIFIVSDPDLLLNKNMPKNVGEILLNLSETHKLFKVGLALDISDSDKFVEGELSKVVIETEKKYWERPVTHPDYVIYEAILDTTFCLVNRKYAIPHHIHQWRIAGNFTCKHLPWYQDWLKNNIPKEELEYWMINNKSSSILQYVDPTK